MSFNASAAVASPETNRPHEHIPPTPAILAEHVDHRQYENACRPGTSNYTQLATFDGRNSGRMATTAHSTYSSSQNFCGSAGSTSGYLSGVTRDNRANTEPQLQHPQSNGTRYDPVINNMLSGFRV